MISVLLATHDGAGTLPMVLAAYSRVQAPEGGLELVVVDNASIDSTPQLLAGFRDRLPLLVLRTEHRGKNLALNLGLTQCRGSLVVLTDDDTVPPPDLLVQYAQVAARQTAFDLFGGRIIPLWPERCPDWIERLVNLGATYGITPPHMVTGPTSAEKLWGSNMAVRKSVFDAGYRFDENVGPTAGEYAMGSETEFSTRVEKAGHRAWYVADAVVEHIIRPHQLEREWIVQRAFRHGRGQYRHEVGAFSPDALRIRRVPWWKYRELAQAWLRWRRGRLRRDFDQTFSAEWSLSFLRGYFAEAAYRRRARAL